MNKLLAATLVVPTVALAQERPTITRLENGIRIVAKEARGTGLVAVACFVDGGNRTEPAELSGLSHYYEHLVFRGGTERQKELETRKVFTQLGTFYGYTTEDSTCFYVVVPVASLDEALWRHVDAVTKVQVTQEKVDKERDVVLNEYRTSVADSPGGTLWHELYRTAFAKHPYGRTTIGLREVIESSKLDRFRSFYEERYVANQIVLGVVGDLPREELVKKVAEAWKSVPKGKESFELGVVEPPQEKFRSTATERENLKQTHLALAFRATAAVDRGRVVHDVLSFVLAGGESARLPRALTQKRIALSAGAWAPSCKDPGLFVAGVDAEPEKEEAALAELVATLRGVAASGISEEELANAKRRLSNETIFAGESLKDEALRMGTWTILGDPLAGATYLDKVAAVTAEEVKAAARTLFRSSNATLSVVRPKGQAAPDAAAIVAGLDAAPTGVARTEHSSGARIIIEESRRNRVVALELRISGGQLAEPDGQAGVAQLVERCLDRGTKQHDRASLARAMDHLAVRIQTSSGSESTGLSIRATDETFEQALALASEILHEPTFPEDEVRKAREETLEAIRAVDDDSYALTQQEYARALYGDAHPYGRPVAGTKATVEGLKRDDLVRFHERVYRPEAMIVAVVGAIDRGRAEELVEKYLLRGAKRDAAALRYAVPPAPPAKAQVLLVDRKREQATLNLGVPCVEARNPDYLAIQVACRHLGNALFFKYVYEEGVAYRMWTLFRPGSAARPFTFETGIAPKNFARVREGLVGALGSLVETSLSEEDLAKAKKDFLTRTLLARETNEDRARSFATYELLGLGHDWEDRLAERLAALERERVTDALRRRIDPSKLTLVVVGDRAALEAAGVTFPAAPAKREPD